MTYKLSMFSYRSDSADGMIIYNSLGGTKSIRKISETNRERINELFETDVIEEERLNGLDELVRLGYFVPVDFDEKLNRKRMQMEHIARGSLMLVVHTTKACNFRCKYCALDFEPQYMDQQGCEGVIKFVRRNIAKYNSLFIDWFGGEPLLGMETIEQISKEVTELCRRAKKPYYSGITTNGYLLTPEVVEKLIKMKVYSYIVTLDGIKNTHDNQRILANGEGSFDQIIANLEYIRDHVSLHAVKVIIRTNITADINEKLEDYYNFMNEKFGQDKRFSLFIRPAGDWGGERVKQFADHLIHEVDMDGVLYRLADQVKDIKYNLNFEDLDFAGTTCSAAMMNKYVFGCDGLISKCDTCNEERAIGRMEDGKLLIDRGKENAWTLGYRYQDEECDDCYFSGSCFMGACPKAVICDGRKNCARKSQIDSLLLLYVRSTETEVI